ncbi:MFS transporter, partial [Francisella tularensis subsp. holarctica]|nr:MFS transporter [Francisella tularensis subsp. holarctica]
MLKKITNNFGLAIGIIGLIIFMFGLTETDTAQKNLIVIFATFFLFLSAAIQKEHFFTVLQVISFVSDIMFFYNLES